MNSIELINRYLSDGAEMVHNFSREELLPKFQSIFDQDTSLISRIQTVLTIIGGLGLVYGSIKTFSWTCSKIHAFFSEDARFIQETQKSNAANVKNLSKNLYEIQTQINRLEDTIPRKKIFLEELINKQRELNSSLTLNRQIKNSKQQLIQNLKRNRTERRNNSTNGTNVVLNDSTINNRLASLEATTSKALTTNESTSTTNASTSDTNESTGVAQDSMLNIINATILKTDKTLKELTLSHNKILEQIQTLDIEINADQSTLYNLKIKKSQLTNDITKLNQVMSALIENKDNEAHDALSETSLTIIYNTNVDPIIYQPSGLAKKIAEHVTTETVNNIIKSTVEQKVTDLTQQISDAFEEKTEDIRQRLTELEESVETQQNKLKNCNDLFSQLAGRLILNFQLFNNSQRQNLLRNDGDLWSINFSSLNSIMNTNSRLFINPNFLNNSTTNQRSIAIYTNNNDDDD